MRIARSSCLGGGALRLFRSCATATPPPPLCDPEFLKPALRGASLLLERDHLLFLGCSESQQDSWLNLLVDTLTAEKARAPRNNLGLLILTSSKLQSAEVYSKLMAVNKDRKLNVSRLGSVSYLAPMVTSQEENVKRRHAELKGISVENLKQIAESDNLDVLVATIWETSILSPWSKVYKPTYVVLQDFELLVDENHRLLDRALYCMSPETKRIWTSRNSNPKIPLQISHWLPEPNEEDPNSLPIIYQNPKEKTQILGRQSKVNKVIDLIKKESRNRGIVFCRSASEALELTELLVKANITAFPLTSGVQPYPNSWSLFNFENKASSVLVCEELILRPVKTKEANYAIWLDPPTDDQESYYRKRAIISAKSIYIFGPK